MDPTPGLRFTMDVENESYEVAECLKEMHYAPHMCNVVCKGCERASRGIDELFKEVDDGSRSHLAFYNAV